MLDGRFHGEENEEYEEAWATAERGFRFGRDTKSFNYRYFVSTLRLLQMRCNYVLHNAFTIEPKQFCWMTRSLAHSVAKAPDAWCCLREDFRMFRLDRIQSIEFLDEYFRPKRVGLLREHFEQQEAEGYHSRSD